ncbi:MAG TPA: hypothetical protein VM888_06405 [Chitinophagaceae bacterium]|nr:hypothetical protein [Chitinophagaceae bacterium]
MLDKIFSRGKKKEEEPQVLPDIHFGRYSDNNKSVEKLERWNEAEALFKEKKYHESIAAFFDYLRDEEVDNVLLQKTEKGSNFQIYQGSKIIKGSYNAEWLEAEVALASMPVLIMPVMRRLLEMNFSLYYTHYALKGDDLCMLFDSDIETANPSKLYYGLKELSIKADKQDDLLVQDFTALISINTEHVTQIPVEEKEVKYKFFQEWIKETLALIQTIDADKYAGGVAYVLLALAYRIDFLIVPEGKLLSALEKIVQVYFKKDDRPLSEKNAEMIEGFKKLQEKEKEEFFQYLFRSRYTFSIVNPQNYKTVSDAIYNANQNIGWYKDNKHPEIAAKISEYGIAYCQYTYSLPRPVTEFFLLFTMFNYPEYFDALGFKTGYYSIEKKEFNKEAIIAATEAIQQKWLPKYSGMKFNTENLKFKDKTTLNESFTSEVEALNLEIK